MASERIWTAALVVIGDEILSGRTQDKNVAQIAQWLNVQGIRLAEVRVVADREEAIVEAVNTLRARNDYLFTTGGIGPTHDDITVDAIAAALGEGVAMTLDPTERRPSSSTSVRISPSARRFSALIPARPELIARRELAGRKLPATAGIWFTKSARLLVGELFWISCWVSTVSGVGDWNPSRTTRDPVTRISPSACVSAAVAWSVCGTASCANAGVAMHSAARLVARASAGRYRRKGMDVVM
ncbi:hypothetical protein LTR94_026407, partial [Friedmanniomyces endolithicus]